MKYISSVRRKARKFLDSFYNINIHSKKEIGTADSWFALTDRLKDSVVLSGGAGKDITFEIELAKRYGCKVFLFDPSPTGIKTINSLTEIPESLQFFPIGLAATDGIVFFDLPENPEEGSFTFSKLSTSQIQFPCKKLSTIVTELGATRVELLKIDIEGFEYDVIDDLISSDLKIRQICVEFHDFMNGIPRQKTERAIRQLKDRGYKIIHKKGHDYTFLDYNQP